MSSINPQSKNNTKNINFSSESKKNPEEKLNRGQLGLLIFVGFVLASLLITFISRSSILIGNCRNNVSSEYCNKPAGDFAIEPDSSSANVLFGCGLDQSSACIFPNIGSISDAIKKCNSLPNLCNRFIYKNNTMTVVSLTGNTIESQGNHMFVRQNGVTFQGSGNINNSYIFTEIQGESTSVTSAGGITAGSSGITSSGYTPPSSGYTPPSSGGTTTSSGY